MRFDRTAPGGGMVIYTKAENGKCLLEFQFFYEMECFEEYFVEIKVVDGTGEMVFHCNYPVKEEELARGLLLHPHLWNGLENPYLYRVSARLMCRESTEVVYPVDERKQILPLRSFRQMDRKGWYLNGKPFEMRGVLYSMTFENQDGVSVLERAKADLELLRQMGANTICLDEQVTDEEFISLCEEMGFVIWCGMGCSRMDCGFMEGMAAETRVSGRNMPRFSGEGTNMRNVLTEGEQQLPTDFYYYCKACWSKESFVHIVPQSLKRQENGNYSLRVYSNQKRVALYVDGVLFEFRVGAPEYVFEEIPGKKMPLMITVEAGECRKSMSFYLCE